MSVRSVFLCAFLGFVFAFAGLLAMDLAVWWLTPVYWLSHYQLFHIAAHFSIFAGVVILHGPQKRSAMRLWVLVLSGGVLLELVQIALGGFSFTRSWLLGSVFDIGVDVAGAAVCWFVVTQHRHRKMLSLPGGRLLKL